MPLLEPPALREKYWEFCYERSIGNIGTLIDWLTDAYDLSLSENANTLTLEHLKETAKSASECEQMVLEAIEGEEKLTDSADKSNKLRIMLGLNNNKTSIGKEKLSNQDSKQPHNASQSSKKTQPFKRKPKRDPVGGELA
ncbi:ATPase [Nostoc carneum NIES-2107]|nr:ATPase [Nostoc carneum NIES-2107]